MRAPNDITERQWAAIFSELKVVEARMLRRLNKWSRAYLPQANEPAPVSKFVQGLGQLELELSSAFNFYDTFMDVLTQRHTPELGRLLAGCDVLAWDAIYRDHPALTIVEPPVVYCSRGFGASTLREGIRLPGRGKNPIPLVQIPYSRLKEKVNLTSIMHEVGHEAMVRLGMVRTIPALFRAALQKAGAPAALQDLFALWSSEIGPDFWTFCACGPAQAGTVKEILALPSRQVFGVSWTDPHPPPYLRVLLSVQWCRHVWGVGDWDRWEKEWLEIYPLSGISQRQRELLTEATRYLPLIASALLNSKFRVLTRRRIPDLFELNTLAPSELNRVVKQWDSAALDLKGFRPCAQLAVFRSLRETKNLSERSVDQLMTQWLMNLSDRRKDLN